MQIDGRKAFSGTAVVLPDQKATIDLPFGPMTLVFNPLGSPAAVQLVAADRTIIFNGTDNPVGLSSALDIPTTDGGSVKLLIAVYAIGASPTATHVVHYTVS